MNSLIMEQAIGGGVLHSIWALFNGSGDQKLGSILTVNKSSGPSHRTWFRQRFPMLSSSLMSILSQLTDYGRQDADRFTKAAAAG